MLLKTKSTKKKILENKETKLPFENRTKSERKKKIAVNFNDANAFFFAMRPM